MEKGTQDFRIRLFVDATLSADGSVALSRDQAHYLGTVMRRQAGNGLLLFNGRDGEWQASIEEISKRGGTLSLVRQTRPQDVPPDLWLLFAPVKRARLDFMAEHATELGVSALLPVMTERTNAARVNETRLRANAIEAAEQSGRLTVPEIRSAERIERLLTGWEEGRVLFFGDESGGGAPATEAFATARDVPAAILIGPEGGFAPRELERLAALPFARGISLGPRILRAETAAIAALTLFQAVAGDWANDGASD